MDWRLFDLGSLSLHLFALTFVLGVVMLGELACKLSALGLRRMLAADALLALGGTTIVYAALFDSRLLSPFDFKGVLLILFGGMLAGVLVQLPAVTLHYIEEGEREAGERKDNII